MNRYVVTGAAGFIGSHLVEALLAAGDDVVALDAFTDYYDPTLKAENLRGVEVVEADLSVDPIRPILEGAAGVFHLAGQPGVRQSWGADFGVYLRHNVLATQRVFEAAAAVGVRVVHASSSSVYGIAERYPTPEDIAPRPISPYGVSKLASESLAFAYSRSAGLAVVVLRYFTVYGPRQRPDMAFARLIDAVLRGRPFEIYGDGSSSRSFTYVADAVAATVAAMERGTSGGVYNVGGGSEASLLDVIELVGRIAGTTPQVEHRDRASGDVPRTSADITNAVDGLRWRPKVSLDRGLAAQWEWATRRERTLTAAR
jgi:UDP-glucuronate 4-epimerase